MSRRQPMLFDPPRPEPIPAVVVDPVSVITPEMARELAIAQQVCVRPLLRRVEDRHTGTEETIPIRCGSTREAVCPPCAHRARVLRMQQCAEGWHRDQEPDQDHDPNRDELDRDELDRDDLDRDELDRDELDRDELDRDELDRDELAGGDQDQGDDVDQDASERRVRSTRRRQDVPDLPRVPAEDRTIGRTFTGNQGQVYRPSMFLTLTLGSYGPVGSTGAPRDPETYDYRRAALDALHFAKLVDRFWQNLRRCAGYRVQYFAAVEPQRRLAPHLHAALRGTIPKALLRQVIAATYVQLWWPACDQAVYVDRWPVWDGSDYCDPDTGEVLPSWDQAVDRLADDPDAKPAHVVRFGRQADMAGIIAPSADADRAVRYLTKYLTKSIADAHTGDGNELDPGYRRHLDRLHAELRFLPCSPCCANWLRYGIQPAGAGPGLEPGYCDRPAHDRANLGCGGRRVLVSRQWSGKTLAEHRADRATVVREALATAGIVAPETERMAAGVTLPDGTPRFVWTETRPDPTSYARVIVAAVAERARWRAQYEHAKTLQAVDNSFGNCHGPP